MRDNTTVANRFSGGPAPTGGGDGIAHREEPANAI